jgi:glycosyltransferase involved in cell wall biosynthesis
MCRFPRGVSGRVHPREMRILFIHNQAGFQGGAEANIHQVATAFSARGHEVALVYGSGGAQKDLRRFLDPFVIGSCYDGRADGFAKAMEAVRDWDPDVVYVHKLSDPVALEVLLASGLPLVRMVHDHDMWCQRSSRYFPWNRQICTRRAGLSCVLTCGVVRNRNGGSLPIAFEWPGKKLHELRICRRFATHIVQTDFMKSEMVLHGFEAKGIQVLPVAPLQDTSFVKSGYEGRGILFVGQLVRGKGVDFLLRALDRIKHKDWHAVIAGDGTHRATCEALAKDLNLGHRVRFAGRLNREELLAEYGKARMGVVPSVWPEPMGMVGLEYMWAGLPVVGFDAGGIGQWLEHGRTGFLVKPRDVEGMAWAIERLLAEEGMAQRMGTLARRIANERYRHGDYVDRLLGILEEARIPAPV